MPLQEKRDIFLAEYRRIAAESFGTVIKTYEYLMSKVTPEHFVQYDEILTKLIKKTQIHQFASDTINQSITYLAPG